MNDELGLGQQPVVVGVDGSADSLAALVWAEDRARKLHAPVRAVIALRADELGVEPGSPLVAVPPRTLEAVAATFDSTLGVRSSAVAVQYSSLRPAEALVQTGGHAQLLVVGSHSSSGLPGVWRGSIPEELISRAPCPVAVIRSGAKQRSSDIVVGVDGSMHSVEALRWALVHAQAVGASVQAITVCAERDAAPLRCRRATPTRSDAEALLDQTVRTAATTAPGRPTLHTRTVPGKPAGALVRLARTADLLVLGRRGTGLRSEHPLGSVSLACLRRADVPVVVVKTPEPLTV